VNLRPTRPRLLVALAVLAGAVGWAVARLVDTFANRTLPVPWTAPVVMAVLALTLALWARGTRARLAHKPGTKPMDPLVAARSAALAMAASRTGAIVAGFYTGVAISLAPGWDVAGVRDRTLVAVVTVGMAVLVILAGLWLERVCRLPDDQVPRSDDDDENV
jgi:hypothetical protein